MGVPVGRRLLRRVPKAAAVHRRRAVRGGAAALQLLEAQVAGGLGKSRGKGPTPKCGHSRIGDAHATEQCEA